MADETPLIPMIATERLILRARTPDDAEAMFAALSDPELMTYWSKPAAESVEDIRREYAAPLREGWRAWAITLAGTDRAIGIVSAGEKRQGRVSEIGYVLSRDAQGRGIAREAVAGLISHLFAEGQRRVFADTDPDNRGSIVLLESLGFRLEGRLRGEWHTHIGVRDSLIFGLLAEEWRR